MHLDGPRWPWASPGDILDAVFADPRVTPVLRTMNRYDSIAAWWVEPGVTTGLARPFRISSPAPDGLLEVGLWKDGGLPIVALMDPWTAQVLDVR